MNVSSVSNTNFNAQIHHRNYHYEKIEEDLYNNHGICADDIVDFQRELEKLPAGEIIIDEYVKHGGRDYVFGTILPPCGHEKSFMIETPDSENLLRYMYDKIKKTFYDKSEHPECPVCNP